MIVAIFIVDVAPRKIAIISSQLGGLVVSIVLAVWLPCLATSECSAVGKTLQSVGLLFYRFLTCVTYAFFYLSQLEFFPAQIKTTALMLTAIPMRLAVVIIPYVQLWAESTSISIIFTYSLSSLLLVACTVGFPETQGVLPPEIIEELRYEHHE